MSAARRWGWFPVAMILGAVVAGPPGPLASGAAAEAAAPAADAFVLTGARVLAPEGDRWLSGQDVLVEGGKIAAIGPAGSLAAPAGARRLDLAGLHLIPGLIDLHTHLLLHPYDETSWDDQVLREPLELRTIRATVAARKTLEAGFTTIRELGTEGAGFADVALRDAVAAGMIPGPRIFAATRAIVAVGAYGPAGFDPRWEVPKGAQEANGADGVRRAARQQIAAGADWVKVYADYRRRPGAPSTADPRLRRRSRRRWRRRRAPASRSPPTPTPPRASAAPSSPASPPSSTAPAPPTRCCG